MEEIIGQRKSIQNTRPNIKSDIKNFNKSKRNYLKISFNKLILQITFCLIIILVLVIYRNTQVDSYNYNINKYRWIINYTTTYNDIYNSCANYINTKFGFNIPLKVNANNLLNASNENEVSQIVLDESTNSTVEVSNSYDNMKIMADQIKQKYSFVLPTIGSISCPFGNRDPSNKDISSFHLGIDIANNTGTDINCALSGIVEDVGYNGTYGNYIKIVKDDLLMVYAHCSKTIVSKGDEIKTGQKIALMGETGIATGPHLHFEVRKNGLVINPEYLVNFR